MQRSQTGRMVRIAVFYDGGYFDEVSRYYKYGHPRRARLSLEGVASFIRFKVAELERVSEELCPVVESHYFRGRFSASEAEAAGKLKDQALFDDVLIRGEIAQHYLPVTSAPGERPTEHGVDLRLALEAYDLAAHGRYDVLALIGCDGDYVPLVRKLSGLGVRTLVLAWDFRYEFDDQQGRRKVKETRTSQALLDICTWFLYMPQVIDEAASGDERVSELFV
jgi:uncharacterized LabA/DUF88 family protein